jgi:hypothetical protein
VTEHLVHDERVKLQAALLNGLAIVSIASGAIQNVFFEATQSQNGQEGVMSLSIFVLLVPFGVILHALANMRLGSLREKSEEMS